MRMFESSQTNPGQTYQLANTRVLFKKEAKGLDKKDFIIAQQQALNQALKVNGYST